MTDESISGNISSNKVLDLGKADASKQKNNDQHIPSTVLPDTLFTFTNQLKWMIASLKQKLISPRYCVEQLDYLGISDLKKLAFPMKCFCDINLHKLSTHMEWYGYYGLAFPKRWGMAHKIQPVQYINEKSELRLDFSEVFRDVLREEIDENESDLHKKLKDYLLHELMYYKPYQGDFTKRTTQEKSNKCFADECEWRFIPNASIVDMPQVITQNDLAGSVLEDFNSALDGNKDVSLSFEYSDIKYIIVKSMDDFHALNEEIKRWGINDDEWCIILSKIMVWDDFAEDF